jgi:hypothetical protein
MKSSGASAKAVHGIKRALRLAQGAAQPRQAQPRLGPAPPVRAAPAQ